MNKSDSIANLASALAKAQAELPVIKMNAKNPFLKNKYADLGAIISESLPVINSYGLSVSQFPYSHEGRVGITSILMHESGEWIEETITIVPENSKGLSVNQSAGVTLTYLRRYAWAAILGLYAEEDVDGDTQNGISVENNDANDKVKQVMSRKWTASQTEMVSRTALDTGSEGMTAEDAIEILNLSVLPEDAPVNTVKSWFKHYINSGGKTPLLKAADANEAYNKAKKNGGK